MSKLSLTIVLSVTLLPSIGVAGVIFDGVDCSASVTSVSIQRDLLADGPAKIDNTRNMKGTPSNFVLTTSPNTCGINALRDLIVKAYSPLISILPFEEWEYVPYPPVLKIPKIPIV